MSFDETCPSVELEAVTGVYNVIAEHFDQTRQYRWPWIDRFVYAIPSAHPLIYDIGCGTGRNMTGYIDSESRTFIGVDSCSKFVEMCRSKELTCVEASMTDLPFEDASADAILSIAAFHHLSTEERRVEALREMVRVLKNDGEILMSVWSKTQPKKTRRVFDEYGDVMVKWNKHGEVFERYYYIFQIDELKRLFDTVSLGIRSHSWECGNEVFVLHKV